DAMASPRVTSRADVATDEKAMTAAGDREGAAGGEAVLGATDQDTAQHLLHRSLTRLRAREYERADRPAVPAEPLLEVEDLRVAVPGAHGDIDIVDGASFRVRAGETMGLVGESGSGKSVTALAMMGLLPRTARITGSVRLGGTDLLGLPPQQLNALRGHEIAM